MGEKTAEEKIGEHSGNCPGMPGPLGNPVYATGHLDVPGTLWPPKHDRQRQQFLRNPC